METEASATANQPFLNRALRRIRIIWSDLAAMGSRRGRPIRPDLPDGDVERVRELMRACLEDPIVATAARAKSAEIGYLYLTLSESGRHRFLRLLAEDFGLDVAGLRDALAAHADEPSGETYARLQRSTRPPRVQMLRMLNALPDGFKFLVDLRADLLAIRDGHPAVRDLDHDLTALFEAWFDVGLLSFVDIDWNSPASLLEKLIAYEAVHEIRSWDDLKDRLDRDRRCYAFFHPAIPDEPLIFVEVALTTSVPVRIDELLDAGAPVAAPDDATTAVFYSISSTQPGLNGISFGSFLLKQVMDRLSRQLPGLTTFVTLSPIPGFRRWLLAALTDGRAEGLVDHATWARAVGAAHAAGRDGLDALLATDDWHRDETVARELEAALAQLCATYLLHERNASGEPLDPVARFHVLNGARVERIDPLADTSARGMQGAFGMMVNYLYDGDRLESNYELACTGTIAASDAVERLARLGRRDLATAS